MKNIKLELNLNDIAEDMFADADYDEYGAAPSQSFSESVKDSVISGVSRSLINELSEGSRKEACSKAGDIADKFISSELEGIIIRKLRSGELLIKGRGFNSFDELIANRLSRFDIDRVITNHIDRKTEVFAQEMRARYDNVFAAKVVQGLSKQKMLDPNIAKLLLDE